MLNFDKYRERILELINDNGFSGAAAICTVADTIQYMKALEWVVSEYTPCLKDGDGLAPGECIEVRDYEDEDWLLVEFIAYYDGLFICRRVNANKYDVTAWDMARKPDSGGR